MDLKSCDARGDLWTMRLWLHVLVGTILHHKMHRVVIYSIANSWIYRTSCHRVMCGVLLQICSLPTRCQYMYKKHFHDAKSWPLCSISPAPAPSAIALLHRKWLKRTLEVLNFWISRNLKSWSHILKFLCITQLSYKRKLHNPRASAIKMWLEMLNEMVIEILNGGKIFVNWKFKLNKNLNLNLYHKTPRNSNPIKISNRLCTVRYREIWFSRSWLVD